MSDTKIVAEKGESKEMSMVVKPQTDSGTHPENYQEIIDFIDNYYAGSKRCAYSSTAYCSGDLWLSAA